MASTYFNSYSNNRTTEDRQKEQEEKRKLRRVYSTSLINELIRERQQGYDIPYDAFFQRDLDLRAPGVTFRMTDEELDEYQRCYDDALYYVEHYCKFMTDNGLSTVELRDFQKNVIKTVTDETYIPDLDDYGPLNRNVIWMAARQSGKCVSYWTSISCKNSSNKKINKIGELYKEKLLYKLIKKPLEYLYKFKKCKIFIGKLIERIEKYEYRNTTILDDKFIDVQDIDAEVLTPSGYEHISKIYKTKPFQVYEIEFTDGTTLEAADNHILISYSGEQKFVKDLKPNDWIRAKDFYKSVRKVTVLPYKLCMYDITVDTDRHVYYTNDVLSHNTTTVAAFLSWMLIFHSDRNILVVANKEDTAIEIVDKITNVFKGLPYFLKPGCDTFGKTGLKLENGSRILSSATTNTASIGFTIHCILLDEFAHIPDNIVNNFWRSVYPTLSSSKISQCIITSTPNGTTNKFYDIWCKSKEGKNSFVSIRTDYWEIPSHDDTWAAQMRADFGDEEFAQEFELQFNINSKMLLKANDLQFLNRLSKKYEPKEIYIDNQYLADEHIRWHPDFNPNDIAEDDKFIFLIDLAEGVAQNEKKFKNKKSTPDSNTINIFKVVPTSIANLRKHSEKSCELKDAFRFIQVGYYECNSDASEDETYCANVCAALAYDLMHDDVRENVKVMVEMNFNGKSFVQTMQKHPKYYDGTILRTYHTKPVPGEIQRKRLGFKTTSNKEHYCTKGAKLISDRKIIVSDELTISQMQSFGYVRGKLEGIACHDDLSMPVFNHISRMLDEAIFVEWLDDILFNYKDEMLKYKINQMIEEYDMDNPEVSDEEFNANYLSTGEQGFYPSSMSQSMNPYSENNMRGGGYNPYSGSGGINNPYSGMLG